jgi:ribosomal protein S18 acetylase RimI-like enzyme
VIRPARVADIDAIVSLWILVGLKVEPGPAARELRGMLAAGTDLVLVAEREDAIVGAVLGSWDGRRGWVQRLATRPQWRGRGIATGLVAELEARLRARGCAKLNLLIEPANAGVVRFSERIGFCPDELIFMEKWL